MKIFIIILFILFVVTAVLPYLNVTPIITAVTDNEFLEGLLLPILDSIAELVEMVQSYRFLMMIVSFNVFLLLFKVFFDFLLQ